MKYYLSLILLLFIASACNNSSSTKSNEALKEDSTQTPESLQDDDTKYEFSLSGKSRYEEDMVGLLFEEALEKDTSLSKLYENIMSMDKIKLDSSKAYLIYAKKNTKYWESVHDYINKLNDSTLKKATFQVVDGLKKDYLAYTTRHDSLIAQLDSSSVSIQDHLTLLKLFVAFPMMKNYQHNELPDSMPLKNTLDRYDDLHQQTKEYIEF